MTNPSEGPTLDGIRTKIARAHEHCNTLEREIRSFINSKPYRITYEFNPDTREHIWKLATDPPIIPSVINGIIGDALYNFRSALDHMVWQLVLANNRRPSTVNEFPIFVHKLDFEKASKRKLRGVSTTARDIITKAQPCYGGYDVLWPLQELSNMDKHRYLPIVFVNITQITSQLPFSIGPGQRVELLINTGPMERGTDVLKVIHDNVEMDFEPKFGIAFGEGTPVPQYDVMEVFRGIRIAVIEIAEALKPDIIK